MFSFTRIAPAALVFAVVLCASSSTAKASDYSGGGYYGNVRYAPTYRPSYSSGCYQQPQCTNDYRRSYYTPPVCEPRNTRCYVPNTYVNRYDCQPVRSYVNRY
ncbi:MAG: hypothetical protein WCT04_12665 [Planctomycetota bacterium]